MTPTGTPGPLMGWPAVRPTRPVSGGRAARAAMRCGRSGQCGDEPPGARTSRVAGCTVSGVTGMAGGRAAVVVPGLFYRADGPLLMYAGLAVERRGGSVRRISWTVPHFGDDDDERAWVAARVSEAVDAVTAATGVAAPVVIGK